MSSSKGFTEEELAALMPWAVPRVGISSLEPELEPEARQTPVCEVQVIEEEVETAPMLTAAEIELMQKQAYDEASEQGRKDGWAQGHRDGYTAGHEQGYAAGQAEISELASHLELVLNCLGEPLDNLDEQVVNEMATLSIAIARQLIRRELKTDPGQIVAVVRSALASLPSASRKVALYLHPDDAELVRNALSVDDGGQRWKLVPDPLLSRGGCKVMTESSSIDATVETRLAAVIAKTFGGDRSEDNP